MLLRSKFISLDKFRKFYRVYGISSTERGRNLAKIDAV